MIRILHAADLHLDSPFQALDRDKATQRRREQRALLERIAALAVERRADIVLLAGDLLDSDSPYPETARLLAQILPQIGVPVFIAPGNHDWYGPRSPWVKLEGLENIHIFTEEALRCIELPELNARVWGAAFTARHRAAPLAGFHAEQDGDAVNLLVLHGEVGNPASLYGPISEDDLARSGADYAALGHVHAFSGLRKAGDTFYAWPGCPEGRGFDETGEKGVILAEVGPGRCRAEFIPLPGRRYEILDVDITDRDPRQAVLDAVPDTAGRDIYRVWLTGQTDAPVDLPALTRALEGRFFALELRDGTQPRRNVWDDVGSDSLRGLFLARLHDLYEQASADPEQERIYRAAVYGLQALENGEEPPLP